MVCVWRYGLCVSPLVRLRHTVRVSHMVGMGRVWSGCVAYVTDSLCVCGPWFARTAYVLRVSRMVCVSRLVRVRRVWPARVT